jgi:hypothetical protein
MRYPGGYEGRLKPGNKRLEAFRFFTHPPNVAIGSLNCFPSFHRLSVSSTLHPACSLRPFAYQEADVILPRFDGVGKCGIYYSIKGEQDD